VESFPLPPLDEFDDHVILIDKLYYADACVAFYNKGDFAGYPLRG
jgi:hypothetical protein